MSDAADRHPRIVRGAVRVAHLSRAAPVRIVPIAQAVVVDASSPLRFSGSVSPPFDRNVRTRGGRACRRARMAKKVYLTRLAPRPPARGRWYILAGSRLGAVPSSRVTRATFSPLVPFFFLIPALVADVRIQIQFPIASRLQQSVSYVSTSLADPARPQRRCSLRGRRWASA